MTRPGPRNLADIRRELLELKDRRRQADQAERERIAPVPREGKLAVSELQRYLWFLYQLAPESATYNEPQAMRLRGDLDVAALAEALRGLVARHESLRTRFGDDRGVPFQVIDPPPAPGTTPDGWPLLVDDGAKGSTEDWVDALAAAPFDLSNGPIFRFGLRRVASDDHVLVLVWHHIITDGWSTRQIADELAMRYDAARSGAEVSLPELSVQPADHAAWQRRWLLGAEFAAQVNYWREALAGIETLEFPSDRPRPHQPTGAGAIAAESLPADLVAQLRELASRESVSLLAVLQAAFEIVLARYTGQENVAFGSLLPGRTRSELEPLVGFFANTVVVRGSVAGNPSFRELVRRCNDTMLDAMAHQDVPFGSLVEALKPERLPGRNPLFQHLMTLLPAAMVPQFRFGEVRVEPLPARLGTSRFDYSIQVTDDSDTVRVWVEYSTELFDGDRIERLIEHLQTALAAGLAAPDTGIDTIDVLPKAERGQVLVGWNPALGVVDGRLLPELVRASAVAAPGAVAVRFVGGPAGRLELTYGQLEAQANRLAHHLLGLGVHAGEVVAVLLERGLELPVAELGIVKAGAAWLPLDPQYPRDRLAYQLADAHTRHVLTTSDLADRLPATLTAITLDHLDLGDQPDTPPTLDIGPEDAAYVIYTSGSTGTPKGVMVPHRAIVNFCAAFRELFHVNPTDRILQFSNPAFNVSVSDFFATFAAGATLIAAPRTVLLDPPALQQLLADQAVTLVDIPPPVLSLLDPTTLDSLRVLFIGMEPFGAELVNRWARPGREFHNGYGPTEATITCIDYRCPDHPLTTAPPIGQAMANQRAYVLDPHLRPTPIGIPGQLYLAGAGLAHGYLGRTDLTADTFLPDPYAPQPGQRMYATGDLARWRTDGNLEFLGRADRQIKIRGLRIELGEIEHVLAGFPGLRQVTVAVKDAGTPQARLIGYLVSAVGQTVDPEQVRQYLTERLPLHMIPTALIGLDELPLTATGKVDTARLPDVDAPVPAGPTELRTETEHRLAEIWCGLLGLDAGRVGARDNFFNVGGNSLQVTQLISRIRDSFQVTLEARQLFQHPVLEQLASQIDTARQELPDGTSVAQLEAEIAELSEAELDRLLGGAS